MNEKNLYYICHYCVEYKTSIRKDMVKHFNRKIKCNCNSIISYENAKILTLSKKYYFYININNLSNNDLLFIVNHYNETNNHIYSNFKNIDLKILNNEENEENEENEDYEEKDDYDIEEDDNSIIDLEEDSHNDVYKKNEEFKKKYYNKEKNRYVCDLCFSEYKSKQNMFKHLMNKKNCLYKRNMKKILEENIEKSMTILTKTKENNEKISSNIVQNYNFNNVQNIQNNLQNNNISISIKDFVNENYDLTHIHDSYYQNKDFFLYNNFLKMILENEKNQNIFFSNNEAFIYTENELNKMSSDKAGYIILDKLSKSFGQLLSNQDEESKDYYSFITKYYYLLKGQYKHDTIYKEYDINEKKFVYTSHSNLFRSRDKYLNKMISTVNKHSDNTIKNMNVHMNELKEIPLINPNIEDFVSIKMRYRDLKD